MQTIYTHLVCYPKVIQYFGECSCEVYARMRLGNLNKVKQETYWLPVMLKMDGYSNISLVVR